MIPPLRHGGGGKGVSLGRQSPLSRWGQARRGPFESGAPNLALARSREAAGPAAKPLLFFTVSFALADAT